MVTLCICFLFIVAINKRTVRFTNRDHGCLFICIQATLFQDRRGDSSIPAILWDYEILAA
jgi:hypothetical protein